MFNSDCRRLKCLSVYTENLNTNLVPSLLSFKKVDFLGFAMNDQIYGHMNTE